MWNESAKYLGDQQKMGRAVTAAELARYLADNSEWLSTSRRKAAGVWAQNVVLPKNEKARRLAEKKGSGSATEPEIGPAVARSEHGTAGPTFPEVAQILEYLRDQRAAAASLNRWQRYRMDAKCKFFYVEGPDLYKIDGSRRQKVLKSMDEVHEAVMRAHGSGHFKRDTVLAELKKHVWFPGNAKAAAEEAIKKRTACRLFGPSAVKAVPPMRRVRYKPKPWELVAIDLKHMPESKCGKNWMLIMVDHFTKFAMGAALADKKAEGVISVLLERALCPWGA